MAGFRRTFWYDSDHERAAELTLADVLAEDAPNAGAAEAARADGSEPAAVSTDGLTG